MQVLLSVFNWVLISSVLAIVPACIILLVKFALKNSLGARWHYYIWLLLVVRLLLPYSPQSPFSIYNFTGQAFEILPVYQDAYKLSGEKEFTAESTEKEAGTPSGSGNDQIAAKENAGNPVWADFSRPTSARGLTKFAMVWLAGLLIFSLYTAFINIALSLKIRKSRQLADGPAEDLLDECKRLMDISKSIPIRVSTSVNTPALIGIFRPKILLPAKIAGELEADELKYVFLHELAHYRRKDILFVWLTVVIRALHWFNPLVWYCFYQMDQDREAACDAMVLSRVKPEERLKYGHTIIHLLKMLPSLQKSAPGVGCDQ
jgi:beta-lactamase regulating signal transducer with metallopeptidase domain